MSEQYRRRSTGASSTARHSSPSSAQSPSQAGAARPARRPARRPDNRAAKPVRGNDPSALDRALAAALARPAPEPRTFAQLQVPAPLVSALARRDIHEPFAIQARTLPDALAGRDVLGRAQTGSGKTLAFGIPMLTRLAGSSATRTPSPRAAGGRGPQAPRALILVPTRELARQVGDELAPLGQSLGLRLTTVYGGAPIGRQQETLRRGVDVVVATPGRLVDLLERGSVVLSSIEVTVLDEADHMADLGFLPVVTRLMELTPPVGQRLMFSATLDRVVERLATRFLTDPAVHAVAQDVTDAGVMEHRVFALAAADKVAVAAEIAARPARTLFFVRTKHGADRLAKQLGRAGVDAAAIHGNLNQNQRLRALDAFSSGRTRVLVATDVAARGLHVDDIDLVVHYDPATDHKDYLHRSGRTARAGASGVVVSFAETGQLPEVLRLHRGAAVEAETEPVHVGHPAVRELAQSGEPIQVRPASRPEPSATRPSGNHSSGARHSAARVSESHRPARRRPAAHH